jgi:uncharacterized protein
VYFNRWLDFYGYFRVKNQRMSNQHELVELARAKMPFGKYQGKYLAHLPESYLVWFHQKGFPPGKLGRQLALMYEIKSNGIENLIYPLMPKD